MIRSERFSRREALSGFAGATAAALLPGCTHNAALPSAAAAASGPDNDRIAQSFLDAAARNLLALSPESATVLGIDKGEWAPLRARLSDRSANGQARFATTIAEDLRRARALDLANVSPTTRTSVEVLKSAYAIASAGFALPYGDVAVGGWRNTPYVVIQNVGAYLDVPRFLDSDHVIETAVDAEAYIARLASMPHQLDGELERMRSARAYGLVPPRFLLDKTIAQIRQAAKSAREGGTLVESITRRTKAKGITGNWEQRALAISTNQVAPALERQLAELEAQRSSATDAPGMWARPGGDAYYAWTLRASTTTGMTPEEVHRMGVAELAELHARMDPILKGLGYSKGTVGQRMIALAKDPRFTFSAGDKGRAEIMAYIQEWLGRVRAELPRAFNTLVKGNLEVKRLPPEEEPGAPNAYGGAGSIDGSIPGKFWINLRTTELHSKFDLPDLAFHEAIPGHVWQGEYANKLPLIRTLLAFNAYSEGWALYAQQLADELGLYNGFPAGRLGFLQGLSYRAARLVVDTGLHAKRWSREQALQYFHQSTGRGLAESNNEIDRYCSWPGQACGYKVGHSEILRQRERAQAALGGRYDLRAFNDTVVLGGNVPLDVLARNVEAYIAAARG
jgi:uncharacterized protein (DUF885 family)